ncbi:VOC family protein [Litoreibacter janthinus]|uniref:Glyoxalase-like domain-containing protein n=1 Tax=Litoreibacter janthinus TaxID=670154 RepID=A0A1I6GMB2_9RHOB|nr:VOC family protein [Litoreibacter janthinus]SFR43353.1 Glyoxalase-like domain-containing protein [Litoreibacter janthinus]
MNLLRLDHLALSAETLDAGRAHVEHALGVELTTRGEHPQMGTHNRLLSLGPDVYFEVISINPDAPAPDRPRWFNIDSFSGPPRLTNWILATDDLNAALEALPSGFGVPMSLQRGDFRWSMAIPDTGILPWGGWAPALIQWHGEKHPAPKLPDQGVRLGSFVLHHPDAGELAATLAPLLPRDTVLFEEAGTPSISASFDTPQGRRTLT